MATFIDLHVIQSVPPSNLNRDDAGSPKSAVYGGVRRLRVSSQSWKHATRHYFAEHLDSSDLGIRTKRVLEVLAAQITRQAPDLEDSAIDLATEVFKAARIKLAPPRTRQGEEPRPDQSAYFLFLSGHQLSRLAQLAIDSHRGGAKIDAKQAKAILGDEHSVDIALFGRMVTDDPDLNVDAACQVAHAISVHAAENEYDFYTAVDDAKRDSAEQDAGAGMMGTMEFSSATLYRYATVNLDQLAANLGDNEATLRALTTFITAFTLAMPTGKQNSYANRTVPDAVVVQVRHDQPVSLVGAFEKAVASVPGAGYVDAALAALARYEAEIEDAYGLVPDRSFVVGLGSRDALTALGEKVSFKALSDAVRESVSASLPQAES